MGNIKKLQEICFGSSVSMNPDRVNLTIELFGIHNLLLHTRVGLSGNRGPEFKWRLLPFQRSAGLKFAFDTAVHG